jgi:hypothetical protein
MIEKAKAISVPGTFATWRGTLTKSALNTESGIRTLVRVEAVYGLADDDVYRCPAGETLTRHFTSVENGMNLYVYWTTKCAGCSPKSRCTSGKERRIKRWQHEAVIDAMQERLDRRPYAMRIRRATVEHTFGRLKAWMGATHFKTRTLDKVRTEMSLHVLVYNLKRVVAMLGPQSVIETVRA